MGCRLWGRTESDTTEVTQQQQQQQQQVCKREIRPGGFGGELDSLIHKLFPELLDDFHSRVDVLAASQIADQLGVTSSIPDYSAGT